MSKVYKEFQHLRVVRRSEIAAKFNGNTEKTNNALRWLLKSGKAQRIKTGLYYFKKPDEWYQKEVAVSPWLIANRAVNGSIIAYHSALSIQGWAYSVSRWVQVAIDRKGKKLPVKFEYQNAEYHYYQDNVSYGVEEVPIGDVMVKTITKERILLDAMARPDRFFGIVEFLQSVESLQWINPDKLFEYLPHYPTTAVKMRLGWLLERFQKEWYINDEILEKLQEYRPHDPAFLVANKRKDNKRVKKWNLMVPKTLDYIDEF